MDQFRKAIDPLELVRLDINGSISFNGRDIIFKYRDPNGIVQLFAFNLRSRAVRQLTTSTFCVDASAFSPDGEQLIVFADENGNERYSIFELKTYPRSGKLTPLIRNEKSNFPAEFSPDSKKLAYASGEPGGGYLVVKDLESGKEKIFSKTMPVLSLFWAPEGNKIVFAKGTHPDWNVYILDLNRETYEELPGVSSWAMLHQWSKKGILLSDFDKDGSAEQLKIWDAGLKDAIVSPYDKDLARYSQDGYLAYTENRDCKILLCVLEPSGEQVALTDEGTTFSFKWRNEKLAFLQKSPVHPGEIWLYNAKTRLKEKLFDFAPDGFPIEKLVRPKLIRYQSFDGREVSGLLFTPKDFKENRAIVFPHGGPTGQSLERWYPLVQYLVISGFTVFQPNFRGSTGYGRNFLELNIGDLGGGDLEDVVYAAKYLEENLVSSGRVGILGISYGGYLTVAALTMKPDIFAGGAAVSMYFNCETEYEHETLALRELDKKLMGGTPEVNSLYEERSPSTYAENLCVPLLIIQGSQDPRTPVSEAFFAAEVLSKEGKSYRLIIYGDEGHYPQKTENLYDMFQSLGQFFERCLPTPNESQIPK